MMGHGASVAEFSDGFDGFSDGMNRDLAGCAWITCAQRTIKLKSLSENVGISACRRGRHPAARKKALAKVEDLKLAAVCPVSTLFRRAGSPGYDRHG
jgi:hypothetical protein